MVSHILELADELNRILRPPKETKSFMIPILLLAADPDIDTLLRPIVSSVNTLNYNLAKFLVGIIQPLTTNDSTPLLTHLVSGMQSNNLALMIQPLRPALSLNHYSLTFSVWNHTITMNTTSDKLLSPFTLKRNGLNPFYMLLQEILLLLLITNYILK